MRWQTLREVMPRSPAMREMSRVYGRDQASEKPEVRLAVAIPELMNRANVPGLSVALVRGAAGRWSRSFGVKQAGAAEAVRPDTIYQAASLSKPVFAYAVLKLAERGGIDLDAPLTAYLPDPYVPDDPLLDQVTARRVLCHTTGWPNRRPEGQPLRRRRAPGEQFGYSGEGYIYLQRVVEYLTGEPLDAYMQRSLLGPLGMARSSYAWAPPDDQATATSHDRTGNPCPRYTDSRPVASWSLHSSAEDFACFLAALLTSGDEPWRLSAGGVAEMLRPHVHLNGAVAWGLGWGLEFTDRGRAFWQWGDNPGYKSFAMGLPDLGEGMIVMTNGDNGTALWEPIVHLALGGDHPALAWLAAFYGVPNVAAIAHAEESRQA